ncbi:MAG: hypothetical protein PVH54_05180 [Gammaproteobacteria bacterium]|jgi:hypothetical protein
MIRTITIVSAFLLSTNLVVHAENRSGSLLDSGSETYQWDSKQQHFYRVDKNMSTHDYREITVHNQRVAKNTLKSYSKDALNLIGIPEHEASLIGAAAASMVTKGARLNLNRSRTLTLELKDFDDSERTLYFGVNLDW